MTSFPFLSNRSSMRKLSSRVGGGLLALGLSFTMAMPTLAADPFRGAASNRIGDATEDAFISIFQKGDYDEAAEKLAVAKTAEPNEPLVYAMLASTSYLKGDQAGLDALLTNANITVEKAQALKASDPLRGHLYTAVGIFLQGAHMMKTTEDIAVATPQALGMLQEVFTELDAAEAEDPTDPELNLIKGYMDLMLAVNLPFSNPEEAIERITQYGATPTYIAQRGIAIGYRDLGRYDEAMTAVEAALGAAPSNPELLYLKAQLLNRQGKQTESIAAFDEALALKDQLPDGLVEQIGYEKCRTADNGNCIAILRGEVPLDEL